MEERQPFQHVMMLQLDIHRSKMDFPDSSVGESTCIAGDPHWIPRSGRSAGEKIGYSLQVSRAPMVVQLVEKLPAKWETWVRSLGWEGYPFLYSGLENSMDCIVHRVAKSWTVLSDFHFHIQIKNNQKQKKILS